MDWQTCSRKLRRTSVPTGANGGASISMRVGPFSPHARPQPAAHVGDELTRIRNGFLR
ncbi:hypothetical protein CFAEC_03540 [Corynebacterium faecale]|nr:hypothetical protein CFAEC_03540 [Corynebacterium faecale]